MTIAANCVDDGLAATLHVANQAFVANNTVLMQGQAAYAENTRYSYLIGKDQMSSVQALGFRTATEAGSGRERQLSSTGGTGGGTGA